MFRVLTELFLTSNDSNIAGVDIYCIWLINGCAATKELTWFLGPVRVEFWVLKIVEVL